MSVDEFTVIISYITRGFCTLVRLCGYVVAMAGFDSCQHCCLEVHLFFGSFFSILTVKNNI